MNTKLLLVGLTCLVIFRCSHKDKESLILGAWKIDSVYSFYNGFGYTKYDVEEQPLRHYMQDGKLIMTRDKESRTFFYRIQNNDSLMHLDQEAKDIEKFLIVKLEKEKLVLRKELSPIFKGNNQQRYELRFFSKVKE